MGFDIYSIGMSKTYTDEKLSKIPTGIKNIELDNNNQLKFTLGNDSEVSITLAGLLPQDKMSSINSLDFGLITKFTVSENSSLLFDGQPISSGATVDLSNYYNKLEIEQKIDSKKIIRRWVAGDKYQADELISYLGKLYGVKNAIDSATTSPDIDPANYESFDGSGGSGGIKFANFTPNNPYSFGDPIIYNFCLLTAKASFTSGLTIDLSDWNVISDMHKNIYDTNYDGVVDNAEHAKLADLAIETKLVQTWRKNTEYTVGQNIVYGNKTYTVDTNFTSGDTFDKTNLTLSATGNHNELDNLQGGDSNKGEFYHLDKTKHDIIDGMSSINGDIAFNNKVLGDMKKSVYDVNNDGVIDKATTLDGLTTTITELNQLHGVKSNVQAQIDALSSIGNFTGTAQTVADRDTKFTTPKAKDMCIVIADETKGGTSTIYLYSTNWDYAGAFTATIRDFNTNPIDINSESTGIVLETRIDPLIARKSDVPNIPNLSLVTTYDQTNTDLNNAVSKSHEHLNKALIDTYTQTNTDLGDAVNKKHIHSNKSVIDNFSEDSSGNPLYKGNPLGSGGGGTGITSLSAFNTGDLADSTNKRYVTDSEKANLQNLASIVSAQTNMNNTLTTISSEIPPDASTSNKLITTSSVDTKISNAKFINLSDVNHTVKPNAFVITNATGNQITYRDTIKDLIKIQKVTDKNGIDFTDVPYLKFNNFNGVQKTDGTIELTMDNLFTTDLLDMPSTYNDGVVVCNKNLQKYEVKAISDLTNSKENKSFVIAQTDWTHDTTQNIYTYPLTHSLNSDNLIVGVYDGFKNSMNTISWKLDDTDPKNVIIIKAPTNDSIKIVLNCSQGVSGNGTGGTSGGTYTVTAGDFIDDTKLRTDKTYSSYKVNSVLGNYMQKGTAYTKDESSSLFSTKINEHIHSNMSTLNKITEDSSGNMYFGDQKILTNLQPFTHQDHWDNKVYSTSTLLVDVNTIFNTSSYNAILDSEFTIRNNIASVDETTDAKSENQVHLVVIDNSIVILDVLIPPSTTQKYMLGISPNIKVMINGSFSANYYLTAY